MYHHSSSALDNPHVVPEQGGQSDFKNGSKNNWFLYILMAGALLATGILIGIAISNSNWTIFKSNKPEKN